MKNYIIPTTIVDDFFDDPELVRKFALGQEYKPDPDLKWPGTRSAELHSVDPSFFGNTIQRFFQLFYPAESELRWAATANFQKVPKSYEQGWAHVDSALITGIVYLDNESVEPDAGTVIYQPKNAGVSLIHRDKVIESFKNTENTSQYSAYRKENNNQFDESIVVKNRFNRLLAFDSHMYHAASNFSGDGDNSRLTLVFFIRRIHTDMFPLQRARRRI